ncbi:hypothetical protein NDA16_000379 [Ustilago loliicola]|nr:hypothetical protein NDA16_000379 [Ustilago loliicola]
MSKLTFTSLLVVVLATLLAYLSGASSSDEVSFPPISADAQYYSEATLVSRNNGSSYPDLLNAGVDELKSGLSNGEYSAVELVQAYLARIGEVNINGPGLRAIIETSPVALAEARKLDAERQEGKIRGPLHGIPIIVKDNVATDASLGMNTTAGSYSLLNSIVPGDSPSMTTLRKAGAIILGKANMSVWAQARGLVNQTQGWSPRGGFGTSAYYPDGNPCSSSSGSAVVVAAGLAVASVGSQTSGSIICPASYNNIVGLKPTIGLVSRNGVIPISATQDSAGPFGRTVKDVAHLLTSMAHKGRDEGDEATWTQPEKVSKGIDYANAKHFHHKTDHPLAGKRLGYTGESSFVNSTTQNLPKEVTDAYWQSIDTLRNLGAQMVEVNLDCIGNETDPSLTACYNATDNTQTVLWQTEMCTGLASYISNLKYVPSAVYDLGGIIYFAIANPELELPGNQTDQGYLIQALQTRPNSTVDSHREYGFHISRDLGIDSALNKYGVQAIVSPSGGDWPLYPIADRAQYPVISVPMGFYSNDTKAGEEFPYFPFPDAPTGINFTAGKWTEPLLLEIAHAYEQATQVRWARKPYPAAEAKSQIKSIVQPVK